MPDLRVLPLGARRTVRLREALAEMSLVVNVAITVGDGDHTYITNIEGETVLNPDPGRDDSWGPTVDLASLAMDRLVGNVHTRTSEQMSQLRDMLESLS